MNIKIKKITRIHGYTEDTIDRTDFIILQMRKIWEQDEIIFFRVYGKHKEIKDGDVAVE
jgi:hypothetical protein